MAEAVPSTSEVSENLDADDFICSVCQEIFQTPVRTQDCQHVFCRKCLLKAIKVTGAHCPFCRGELRKWERSMPLRASDLEMKMRNHSLDCTYCGKRVKLSYMRLHYKACKSYMEEFGTAPKDSKPQSDPFAIKQLGKTYKCPLCPQGNFNRKALLDHCNVIHYSEVVEAVCPICVSLPGGDPAQTTKNFVAHLNLRHQFNYEDYMNVNLDEDAQFQAAVEKSCEASN
ncbi:E3 ubiquitin-protein ligase RNF138 [Leptodactylus fuscus]|uniref:E3 ubiquitin-protein ligase RNF138 n=1 Tax=Leptodactylus fuscus TaxID=238119 RepID=UPI003F4F0364